MSALTCSTGTGKAADGKEVSHSRNESATPGSDLRPSQILRSRGIHDVARWLSPGGNQAIRQSGNQAIRQSGNQATSPRGCHMVTWWLSHGRQVAVAEGRRPAPQGGPRVRAVRRERVWSKACSRKRARSCPRAL
eukprot:1458387-Prymnesium_polylepis.1